MYKFVLLSLVVVFVGVASYLLDEVGFPLALKPNDKLNESIQEDLRNSQKSTLFPEEFQKIHQVFVSDHRTKKTEIDWLKLSDKYFPQKTDGLFDVQVEVFDDGLNSPTPQNPNLKVEDLVILQFSLFDIKSKNKVWEISRSYKISELPEKK